MYRQYAKSLTKFFGDRPLNEFHIGHVREYQRLRSEHAAPTRLNGEISSVLKPVLREANLWQGIKEIYRTLPAPKKKVRKSMSDEEERVFLSVALDKSKPRRLVAGHSLIVMQNTSAGFGEFSHLRRKDVYLSEDIPFIAINEYTKNDFRIRTVPLNPVALRSMRWIIQRWERLGGRDPDSYILPHNATRSDEQRKGRGHKRKSPPDFTRPTGSLYKAAKAIFREAGLPEFVPYDLHSCAITKVLADPDCSDQMGQEIFGHSNTQTKRRYSRQRLEKKAVIMNKMCIEHEPEPPEPPKAQQQPSSAAPTAPTENPLQALIQAEIERQVALALQAMVSPAAYKRVTNAGEASSWPSCLPGRGRAIA